MYDVYDDGINVAVSVLPCHTDDHLAFRVIHYILHFLAKFVPSLSKLLSCFLLGWSTPAATLLPRSRGKPVQLGVKIFLARLLWPK